MPSFGYSGGGSGLVRYGGNHIFATPYQNTTASVIYVDTITLLDVDASYPFATQFALYSDVDEEGQAPLFLLAVTTPISGLVAGSNSASISGAPIAVMPGQWVWIAVNMNGGAFNCNNSGFGSAVSASVGQSYGSGFLTHGILGPSRLNFLLPATASGSNTGPGTSTDVRAPLVIAEPLTDGSPNIVATSVLAEPLTEGYAALRAAAMAAEALAEGVDHQRACAVMVEALYPVPEEPEMITTEFPTLSVGPCWDRERTPTLNQQIRRSTSGYAVRNELMVDPVWNFKLNFDILTAADYAALCGFNMFVGGPAGLWLYEDPRDHTCTAAVQATGDGVTTGFYFVRPMGVAPNIKYEPVGQVVDPGWTVYLNGVAQVSGVNRFGQNQFVFDVAPANGVAITATFDFRFVCSFLKDLTFNEFAQNLDELGECAFESNLT